MKHEELERIRALNAARTPGEVLAAAVEYIPGLTDKPMMGIGLLCADGKPTTKLIAITGEIGAEWEAQSAADAYYLEAAWNGVPALLRHIEEVEGDRARALLVEVHGFLRRDLYDDVEIADLIARIEAAVGKEGEAE